jgi:energy-converting hydrogenase Eha subunit B
MTLKQLQNELLALYTQEKAQMIQLLVSSLSDTWVGIEKTPGVMGGDASTHENEIKAALQRQEAVYS